MITQPHRRHRQTHWGFVLKVVGGILLLAVITRAGAAGKPNILFILVDDYGIRDVGIEGSKLYETPNIDALARSGMRFTQGYAACSVCRSILLGQYPTRQGIADWIGAGCWNSQMTKD